jgi:DNA adenine methylase
LFAGKFDVNQSIMKKEAKSPLRYPGGKSKALNQILPLIPKDFLEFREPFVGGGSVFLAVKQRIKSNAIFNINDLNYDLYCFWIYVKNNVFQLVEEISRIKKTCQNGRELFEFYTKSDKEWTDFERAVRFFVLNRITFSGTVDSGGYSQQAFERRFTQSSIDRIKFLAPILKDVQISYGDYEDLLFQEGEKVFIFLDPPYLEPTKSRLYGKNGHLHTSFEHERFAENMKKCKHKWLITYDDNAEIRNLFDFANIYEWELQYGMNNYKQKTAEKGRELFISNYEIGLFNQVCFSFV